MNTKMKILLFSLVAFFAYGGLAYAATIDSEEQSFVDLLNDYRKGLGRTELKISKPVTNGAESFAENFSDHPGDSNVCIHIDTDGKAPEERGHKYGYYFLTENMGWGYETGQQIFDAWKASSGHKENMTASGGRTIGISRYYNESAIGKTDCNGNTITSPWFWIMDLSDEGVERLVGNNLKDSEMYTSPYRKMSFTIKKYSSKYKKFKAARYAEVKVYDKGSGRLIDHDIADKKGKCSVYMLGSRDSVILKMASFKGKSANKKFTIGNKKSKTKTIDWKKNLKYTVKI
jgi:hypothetical protein